MDYFKRVKEIIADRLEVDESQIQMESRFIEDLNADSLNVVELVVAFEEEFNIQIPDEVVEKIRTVKDAVDHLKEVLE